MVKIAILIMSIAAIYTANAQNACDRKQKAIFEELQELPKIKNLNEFIVENLRYPETAKKDKIEGRVFVCFWIDTLGYTIEHKVAQGIRPDLDEEALRVARLIKFDKPAMNKGKPIKVVFMLPFDFKSDSIKEIPRSWY